MSSKSRPTLNVPKADSYLFLSSLSWVRSYATTTLESAGRRLPSGLKGGACDSRSFQRCCVTLVRCAAARFWFRRSGSAVGLSWPAASQGSCAAETPQRSTVARTEDGRDVADER